MHFESVAIESLDYVLPEAVLSSDALEAELARSLPAFKITGRPT